MSSNSTDPDRQAMVTALAEGAYREGLRALQAELDGYPRPDSLHDVQPDVTGRDNLLHIFAVATSDDLEGEDPNRRWPALAAYAAETGAKFYVVVPRGKEQAARHRARELGINPFILEI
ncbi:hypothetical protein [Thiohalorhabdus sp.]|uniref:hypothetical protein n=1 Tax=Thiohalorhabdus sp. TaxID=3094134 RepID=UPI002FC30EC7